MTKNLSNAGSQPYNKLNESILSSQTKTNKKQFAPEYPRVKDINIAQNEITIPEQLLKAGRLAPT